MRTRTAKKLAQRIDLSYFKRSHPLRRWRTILSIVAPVIGLLWLGGMAVAGSKAPYSSGPVSSAHAFAEMKCQVCHTSDASFRAHVGDKACMTCHDGPAHVTAATPNAPREPSCATCHREHQGRVSLAATVREDFCAECHDATLGRAPAPPPGPGHAAPRSRELRAVTSFPAGHPEFAVVGSDVRDPGTLKFNHEVHAKADLRGPAGPETLQCSACHKPEILRTSSKKPAATGLMASFTYEEQCARCHPLFFDERLDVQVPHEQLDKIMPGVQQSLRDYLAANPNAWREPDRPSTRVPLNFPREADAPARSAGDWLQRRSERAQRLLERRVCGYCHDMGTRVEGTPGGYTGTLASNPAITKQWMPAASFDHTPHLMVKCESCHAATTSRLTSDVLMPNVATCATCHAPKKGASSSCVECHAYHDWSKAKPVHPAFDLNQFR